VPTYGSPQSDRREIVQQLTLKLRVISSSRATTFQSPRSSSLELVTSPLIRSLKTARNLSIFSSIQECDAPKSLAALISSSALDDVPADLRTIAEDRYMALIQK
jgi:hypothetical protein